MRDSTADGAFGGSAVEGSLNSMWSNGPDDSATARRVRRRQLVADSSVTFLVAGSLLAIVSVIGCDWG